MQIREIELAELHLAYQIYTQYTSNITYKEYEDLIYQMIKENYKIILIINNDKPITYAGIKIETTILEKKHIHIYELYTDINEDQIHYNQEMLSYLNEYAKIQMCKNILISLQVNSTPQENFINKHNFILTHQIYKQCK